MSNAPVLSSEEKQLLLGRIERGELSEPDLRRAFTYLQVIDNYPQLHPIECYEPIRATRGGGPHTFAFHCAPNEGRGIFGGNQSSKTYSGAMEAAFRFTNIYPEWYPSALKLPRMNVGRIIVKDFPHSVSEVIEPALRRSIPAHMLDGAPKTNNKGYLVKMTSKTKARFDIVTHDTDITALEGWQGHWAWFDEPPPRTAWVATLRGLVRNRGRWWITCTPLTEPWMYDEIYTNPNYFIINVDMRDNPYLSEEAIRDFESKLTEEEREARMHGRFMHLSGLTYKEFDPAVHIRPTMPIPPDWPRWCICDPHGQRPFALMWFAVDPMGRVWIYDEWPSGWFHEMKSSKYGLRDYVHILREKEMGQTVYRRVIDGRAGKAPLLVGSTDGAKQDTLIDAFQELGIIWEPSYITMTTGITDPGHIKVKEFLRVSPVTGEPSLFVLANCKNTTYAFQHNTWLSDNSQGVAREVQSQFAKDFLDLIRYGLMDDPRWIDPNELLIGGAQNDRPSHWTHRETDMIDG